METSTDYAALVILDSISAAGIRLTTLEVTMPRFILAQFNTHRAFSRNAASSRAIPTAKLIEQVKRAPFLPLTFGLNQRGMQSGEEMRSGTLEHSKVLWLRARDAAVEQAAALAGVGLHKQWSNRLLEPFLWVKVLVSATDWQNFFRLRLHEDAQPEFQRVAASIHAALTENLPRGVSTGEWHLPYVTEGERTDESAPDLRALSVARCARLSATVGGMIDVQEDRNLFERLKSGSGFGHWSPFEHVATPLATAMREKNFRGWRQYRTLFMSECAREEP